MNFEAGKIYHIFNRGNQQQPNFFNEENYLFFLQKMRNEILPQCNFLAYCLMPNHFHWLVEVLPSLNSEAAANARKQIHPIARKIGSLQSSYTRAIQKQEKFTGSLFQQKTKAVPIPKETQFFSCVNHIHQNPLKTKLTNNAEDWLYLSFIDYDKMRKGTLYNQKDCLNCFLWEKMSIFTN